MRFNNFVPGSSGTLYVASATEVISYINVQNTTGSNQAITISINSQGNTTPIISGTLLPSGSAMFDGQIPLSNGDSIIGVAGSASSVVAQIP